MGGFRSTKSGYVSISFMKMNRNSMRYFAFYRPGNPCAPDSPSARLPRQALSQELMEDATMPRVKQASTQKRTTKAAAVKVLGAAGLGLSLVGSASASTIPTADIPQSDKTSPNQRFVLGEEEMADVSLATFYLFDKENDGSGVLHSITLSARASKDGDTSRPSAFAV
jgi:hypothetical protein